MASIFGGNAANSQLHVPLASLEWDVAGIVSNNDKDVVLGSFTVDDNEAVDIRRCFNDITHIFAFGRDVKTSIMSVNVIVFLSKTCGGSSDGALAKLDSMARSYNEKRISVNQTAFTIKLGDYVNTGYLIGMKAGNVNPQYQTCEVTFTFLLDKGV